MRKIAANGFLLLAAIAITAACSSGDDSPSQNVEDYGNLILGKWSNKGYTVNGGQFIDYVNECSSQKDYNEFLENGSITYYGFNEACQNTEVEQRVYEVQGDSLFIFDTFDPPIDSSYKIMKLDQDELVLKQEYHDGPDEHVTQIITMERE